MALFDGIDSGKIFKDKHVFDKTYIPRKILHRDEEIQTLAINLSQVMRGLRPNDMILYGKRGTGKTLVTKYVTGELVQTTRDVRIYNINLRGTRTNFRAWKEIAKVVMGRDLHNRDAIDIAHLVFDYLTTIGENFIILILDEINEVTEGYDVFLYFLLRPHEIYHNIMNKEISCIFITNSVEYPKNLSDGTLSSFKLVDQYAFNPYLANHLRDILYERAKDGLNDNVYDEAIIGLCAAYGAQEHGDARETIKLLVKAAELAEREGLSQVLEKHVKMALGAVEFDRTTKVLSTLPLHQKILALACVRDHKRTQKVNPAAYKVKTTTVYEEYTKLCASLGLEPLSYRRISDFINELDTLGIISKDNVYSRGKSGHITLLVPSTVEMVLTEDYRLTKFRPCEYQSTLM